MQRNTGYQTGVNLEPPVGTAEIRESQDEVSEFGVPVDWHDPDQYHGKTPPPERIIGVGRSF